MKIKMLTSIAGADFVLSPGDETNRFTTAEAARMIAAGFAAPVAEPEVERAVQHPVAEKRRR